MIRLTGARRWKSPEFTVPTVGGTGSSDITLNHNLNTEFVSVIPIGYNTGLGGWTSRQDFYEATASTLFAGYDYYSSGPNSTIVRMYEFGSSMEGNSIFFYVTPLE